MGTNGTDAEALGRPSAASQPSPPLWWTYVKDSLDIVQKIGTIVALIAAAWWFYVQEETAGRLNVSLGVDDRQLSDQWALVTVTLEMENVGKRNIETSEALVRVQKVLPLESDAAAKLAQGKHLISKNDSDVLWPVLDRTYRSTEWRLLRANEKDHLYVEFLIPACVKTAKIYAEISGQFRDLVWHRASLHDLKSHKGEIQPCE